MTYKCNSCGEVFNEDEMITVDEYVPYGDTCVACDYLGASLCPHCRSEEIEEAEQCTICGKWHTWHDEICKECNDKIDQIISDIKKEVWNIADMRAAQKTQGNVKLLEEVLGALREGICI